MTFIIDKSAYRTACLYAACGYEVIARLYLKKHMVGNYELIKRQDIQVVNIKAEQLAGLSQTLFEYHDKLDHFQLKTICSLVYDIAGEIHDWTEKEEEIVMSLEEEARRNG